MNRAYSATRSACLVVAASAFVWACVDSPTTPGRAGANASPGLLGDDDLLDLTTPVEVIERATPLAQDEVVSQTIGSLGGVIHLPAAGLTVTVPPGALSAPTTITVAAPAGELVGYHFLPEGLTFAVPVELSQDLAGTDAFPPGLAPVGLVAAYFQGDLAPTVEALELLALRLTGLVGVFAIDHFSGYVVGTS